MTFSPLAGVRVVKPGEPEYEGSVSMSRAEFEAATKTEKWGFGDPGGRLQASDPIGVKEFLRRKAARVRVATKADQPEIMRLLRLMNNEGDLPSFDERRVGETLARAFNRDGASLFVIGLPGAIQAMTMLIFTRSWYSNECHLEVLFTYVDPACRKLPHMRHLIDFYREMAKQIGIRIEICTATTSNKAKSPSNSWANPPRLFSFVIPMVVMAPATDRRRL